VTRNRTIATLFMIGSACFALGALPGYLAAVGVTADGVTFFIGSLFFTSAGLGQFLQARETGGRGSKEWWAATIQLAGTLFFNASTLHALATGLSAAEADQQVWRPDAFGSICFLVASGLSLSLAGGLLSWRPHDREWWIAELNMLGSIAFGVSAVASYVVPDSGLPRNVALTNLGTFVGALCFLLGAYLLLPRSASVRTV
jgi:hypothetical protein